MTRLARSPAEQREMADRSEQEDGGTRPNNCRHAQTHGPETHWIRIRFITDSQLQQYEDTAQVTDHV